MATDVAGAERIYRLELTPAQMKIAHTALKSMLNDLGHEEHDIHALVHEVLAKLPDENELRRVDLGEELLRRRRARRMTTA